MLLHTSASATASSSLDQSTEHTTSRAAARSIRGRGLVARHGKRVYASMHQLLGDPKLAEEITKNALQRTYCVMESMKICEGQFIASIWLYQVAMKMARNRYWHWRRPKPVATVSFAEPLNGPVSGSVSIRTDGEVTPEYAGRIHRGMSRLRYDYREVLVLASGPTQTYGEIAAILGTSVKRIKRQISRAREQLRRELEKDCAAKSLS